MLKHLQFVEPENLSGWSVDQKYEPMSLNENQYHIIDKPVSGDVPKNFINLNEYGSGVKTNPKLWTQYIIKTGHKWYPIESITEHLLNRLGQGIGISMAESMLRIAGGQIRFLSKYFLSNDQQLVHGAEIYYGYFENDMEFVNEIERKKESRNLLTLQLTKKAIHSVFPNQCETILHELVKMLFFDAWVGNNDRHFFNWGVVKHLANRHPPYFSPVYDTARGLFWNYSENKIVSLLDERQQVSQKIEKYTLDSHPKIGWEGENEVNHFQLVREIAANEYGIRKSEILELFSDEKLNACIKMTESEFAGLMSENRISAIQQVLKMRHKKLIEIVTGKQQVI